MAEPLTLTGKGFSIREVCAVAAGRRVLAHTDAVAMMAKTNKIIIEAATAGQAIYGVTTGLGPRVSESLSAEEIEAFALNTVRGRAHSVGEPLSRPVVRAAMAIRLNTLLTGASGASPSIGRHLQACLNADLVPWVGETASSGAADLLWGGSMGLALIGEGRFLDQIDDTPSAEALAKAGIAPLKLGPRDGLALISHSCFSTALAAIGHHAAMTIWQSAQTAAALSLEGFQANLSPLNPAVLATRPQPGQMTAATDLAERLKGSTLYNPKTARRLQDPLSIRNIVQVHGSVHAALDNLEQALEGDINGAPDNPVVLAETGEILSGGGYLSPYVGVSLVAINHALVQLAAQITARCSKLMFHRFTDLRNGLLAGPGNVAGLSPVTKVAEALFAEICHLATPPVIYPSQLADGVEDTITNSAVSAKALHGIVERLAKLIAFEMIVAAQAIDLRGSRENIAGALGDQLQAIRAICPMLTEDRSMTRELETLAEAIMQGRFAAIQQPTGQP